MNLMKKINRQTILFIRNWGIILLNCAGLISLLSCHKSEDETNTSFQLTSPVISADSLLPVKYTCDGESVSPPMQWSGVPSNTKYLAIIMHHVASPTDIHWYWVLYNIPATTNNLSENSVGIGTFGTNSVNDRCEYAPPCSQGPGRKDYIITIYALSDFIVPSVSASEVNREALLDAMEGKIISSTSLAVWYSRNVK
jgi:Raf kinase inhibitor-like YbhB/YbcL family protein